MCYNSVCIDTCADYVPALEGRAVINLQMGNLFGSFLDISSAIKVLCACARVCIMYIHTYVCTDVCMFICMYICTCVHACVYVRTCVHACVCIYVYQSVYIIA